MKRSIDQICEEIFREIRNRSKTDPQLEAALSAFKMKGIARATALRDKLFAISEDLSHLEEIRDYAKAKLDSLPPF